MSTATHTPGPWAVCETICKGNRVLGVTVDDGKSGFPIAELSNTSGRDRADAHLIAAAPDLLAACKDCMENRGDWGAAMAAALAKAEGRS